MIHGPFPATADQVKFAHDHARVMRSMAERAERMSAHGSPMVVGWYRRADSLAAEALAASASAYCDHAYFSQRDWESVHDIGS